MKNIFHIPVNIIKEIWNYNIECFWWSKLTCQSVFLSFKWSIESGRMWEWVMSNLSNWLAMHIEQCLICIILSLQNIKVFRKIFLNRYFWIPSEIFQHFTHCQCQTCEIDSMCMSNDVWYLLCTHWTLSCPSTLWQKCTLNTHTIKHQQLQCSNEREERTTKMHT